MAAADGVNLYWVKATVDGVLQISGGAPQTVRIAGSNLTETVRKKVVETDEGSIYFSGDTPAGEFTFGIAGFDGNFVAFPNGTFNVSKTLKHGYGIVILCNVVGLTGSGKTIYIAYAGRH
jgi:hypothetical protein